MSVHISGLSAEDVDLIVKALRLVANSRGLEERRWCLSLADRIAGGLEQQQRRAQGHRVRLEVAS